MLFDSKKSAFCAYIVGKRNRGKSHCLIRMLLHPKLLKGKFDEVILINPTYDYDVKYHVVKFTKIYKEFSLELMDELVAYFEEKAKEEPKPKILLILDDCISQDNFKSHRNDHPLNTIAVNGRHWGVSMIILSQKYNAVSSAIRNQLDYLMIFESKNHKEKEDLYEEYGFGTKKEFFEFLDQVYTDPHDVLIIDNITNKYYKNFIRIK